MRHHAGFTGPVLDCHLMSLAEFYGMYLLVWSEELWPRDPAGRATLPAFEGEDGRVRAAVLELARTLPGCAGPWPTSPPT